MYSSILLSLWTVVPIEPVFIPSTIQGSRASVSPRSASVDQMLLIVSAASVWSWSGGFAYHGMSSASRNSIASCAVGVAVGSGGGPGVGVCVGIAVAVAVGVAVGVGVREGVGVAVGVCVGMGVAVAPGAGIGVAVGLDAGTAVAVGVGVGLAGCATCAVDGALVQAGNRTRTVAQSSATVADIRANNPGVSLLLYMSAIVIMGQLYHGFDSICYGVTRSPRKAYLRVLYVFRLSVVAQTTHHRLSCRQT